MLEKYTFQSFYGNISITMELKLRRKIETVLEKYYETDQGKILLVDGARQTGKSYIIRETAKKAFKNYIEINLFEDKHGSQLFSTVDTVEKFNLTVSLFTGNISDDEAKDTLIFLDEIQEYPQLLPLLKFINQKGRYRYICSGSALGVELSKTSSIPMGSISVVRLYPLDFEEYLWAVGVGDDGLSFLKQSFEERKSLEINLHDFFINHLRMYLAIGGLPEPLKRHLEGMDIAGIRTLQMEIRGFYAADCAKYDSEHRLQIMRVYNMLPSFMEQKKKRVVYKKINPKSARSDRYAEEFDYLISSGVALGVDAVSNPVFPLSASVTKNLIKLYLNDVGLLSSVLFGTNINAIIEDVRSINLGSLYETFVAMELSAHNHPLFYYDNRDKGEVDYLINDYDSLSVLPIEVKSGRDYQIHSSLRKIVGDNEYAIGEGVVLSNSPDVKVVGNIQYLPIYYAMFL